MSIEAPYGTWRSPITASRVVESSVRFSTVVATRDGVYIGESRPNERGRSTVVRLGAIRPRDLVDAPFDVRSRVHEYGGGAFTVADGAVFFVNNVDQQIYRLDPGHPPKQLTDRASTRHAALHHDPLRKRLISVTETHAATGQPENRLESIDALGGGDRLVLASGRDFYASPRLSSDGTRLAWLEWSHPHMPWDSTDLCVSELDAAGRPRGSEKVAGGSDESIFQPEWAADDTLYFVSDVSGFWNLHRISNGHRRAVTQMPAEFGLPLWNFEMSTYAPLEDGRLLTTYRERGTWHIALCEPATGNLTTIETPYTEFDQVRATAHRGYFIASSPSLCPRLVEVDVDSTELLELRLSSRTEVDPRYVSTPRPIRFQTAGNESAHALHYPPTNTDYRAPERERPPLLVKTHGGPTASTSTSLNLRTQFFTSRGVAVLDVDYRGSTGYGRAYRRALDGRWGVADVEDCVAGARHLVASGKADPKRLLISGGSAGGYTTLAALTFTDVFSAGASYYGISDLEALASDTHKFEARYLDGLIGPYPEGKPFYEQRSPIRHADCLACPIVFFQGLEDRVVPPNQAERMVDALRAKGIPVAYVVFPDEGHGFRAASNIRRALQVELSFYAQVLGFELADVDVELAVENL